MELGGVSLWKIIVVLLIIVLIFGGKWLKPLATQLGGAAKSVRDATGPPPAPRQVKLENAEPDAEFPERRERSGRG
jgi:sec-independent protein translocase protein TatA